MEARSAAALPVEDGPWLYQPKWDGFRCLAFKGGGKVELKAKSGKDLGRYFPEVVALLLAIEATSFVFDGELVVEVEGRLAFDALQMRLHPATSRIERLARETPARLVLFDTLATPDGVSLLDRPLLERWEKLEQFMETAAIPGSLVLSPATVDATQAVSWLARSGLGTDGVVAKHLDGAYQAGIRSMLAPRQAARSMHV
jgi:ATP-dependent DNA ligase